MYQNKLKITENEPKSINNSFIKSILTRWLYSSDLLPLDYSDLELVHSEYYIDKSVIILKDGFRVLRLKHWFEYVKDLVAESNYISALYWINEVVTGNFVRLSGVVFPAQLSVQMESFIVDLVQMFVKKSLHQENVTYMLELAIQILIKMKKFDFLFNEFLMQIRNSDNQEAAMPLLQLFIRFFASFLAMVNFYLNICYKFYILGVCY